MKSMNVYFCDFCGKPLHFTPFRLILEERKGYANTVEWKQVNEYYICSDCASSLSDKRTDVQSKLYKRYKELLHDGDRK